MSSASGPRLGKLAHGLSFDRIKEAQELLPEAPPEVAKVLASLLATDPQAGLEIALK